MTEEFYSLGPNEVLDSVEAALSGPLAGIRATGRTQALNSLENRVYDIELENGSSVVTKFYRPGRWSIEQISAEHDFLQLLLAREIPVVAPLEVAGGVRKTLGRSPEGIFFAVFPKVQGRILNELDDVRLRILGRYIGRIHSAGKAFAAPERIGLNVETYGWQSLDTLREKNFLNSPMAERYEQEVKQLLSRIEDLDLLPQENFTIHGDCHLGNTLWLETQPFFLDFDDMVAGPPVQDIWMVIRGRDEEAQRQRGVLIDAYEEVIDFPRESLDSIEALRALRMIHYSAWIARRWEDPAFKKTFPDFSSSRYWQEEIVALSEISEILLGGN